MIQVVPRERGDYKMSEDYGNDIVTISDDDGNEYELEHLDTIDRDGCYYMAFLPTDMEEDDENFGLIILKQVERNGEEVLVTLDDDAELSAVFNEFVERLSDEEQ
ncbi:MAG: DUF1292 domain-containing protein [Oscillospiraceae bacterium]|nr:DUF1292 domain-containing protein [Oscillospiraceae bacterium]